MKVKIFFWIVFLVCVGWCVGVGVVLLIGVFEMLDVYDSVMLFYLGLVVELVDDGELVQQCGKYLGVSIVSGFMIEMVLQWCNEVGQVFVQVCMFVIDLCGYVVNVVVSILVLVYMGLGVFDGVVFGVSVVGGVGVQVNGVGQVIQVVGSNNLVVNVILILI